jgi:hypothetical protein
LAASRRVEQWIEEENESTLSRILALDADGPGYGPSMAFTGGFGDASTGHDRRTPE